MSITPVPVPYFGNQIGSGTIGDYQNWDSLLRGLMGSQRHAHREWLSQRWDVSVRFYQDRGVALFYANRGFLLEGSAEASKCKRLRLSFSSECGDITCYRLEEE